MLALYETQREDILQVCFPCATDAKGRRWRRRYRGEVGAGGWHVEALHANCKLQLCVRSCILVFRHPMRTHHRKRCSREGCTMPWHRVIIKHSQDAHLSAQGHM